MPLHLLKLCVGATSIADMEAWIAECLATEGRQVHTTRMMPKRRDEILAGGSLYWIIRGVLACRQSILALDPVIGDDGVGRCEIVLDPVLVPVDPRPRGPFQGWRYLEAKDAPPDLVTPAGEGGLSVDLQRELRQIGVV